ncbi:hypothetical protein [Hymenobacter psychrophilus]|uniref:Uncharacterized protein n=1 Tax=Hymenobacter psychrophilus TaxID=651662 RepID=A0A1H3JES3_9BACT|nr:hypothetical protein [Hymenobacter psychrophilus]SDY37724.1 hypothetical protein SAMN04488069_10819 [Hymenobacter psychrophilus]
MMSARLADPTGQYISLLPTLQEVDSRMATVQAAAPGSRPVLRQGVGNKIL